jgi:hypothetical protein
MKVTVVPAQVTTVEDRIAGNLGLNQLMLLVAPVFGSSALYVILPPIFHYAVYKLVVIAFLFSVCALLAIRIKGKILLFWLVTLLRYSLRPRFYVFNKQTLHVREEYQAKRVEPEAETTTQPERIRRALSLSTAEIVKVQNFMENPAANLHFETKKGNLYVRITEVKPES